MLDSNEILNRLLKRADEEGLSAPVLDENPTVPGIPTNMDPNDKDTTIIPIDQLNDLRRSLISAVGIDDDDVFEGVSKSEIKAQEADLRYPAKTLDVPEGAYGDFPADLPALYENSERTEEEIGRVFAPADSPDGQRQLEQIKHKEKRNVSPYADTKITQDEKVPMPTEPDA